MNFVNAYHDISSFNYHHDISLNIFFYLFLAEMYLNEPRNDQDGKLINVSVFFGCHGDSSLFLKQNMVCILYVIFLKIIIRYLTQNYNITNYYWLCIYL